MTPTFAAAITTTGTKALTAAAATAAALTAATETGELSAHERILQALHEAAARGKKYVWLGAWEKHEPALSFYRKNGFCRVGSHPFVMGDDVQTDYILRKDLP